MASESSSERVPLGEALALRGAFALGFEAAGLSAFGLGAALGFEAAAAGFALGAACREEGKSERMFVNRGYR